MSDDVLTFTYTNWRGDTAERRVRASSARFTFGATEWHPEPQWLLTAVDLDKNAGRDFAVRDIRFAAPAAPPASTIPSEPEAKGEAGAGPVGEAVAFEFDRYIDGILMAEGVTIERQSMLEKACQRAAQIASRGPNGEAPVLVLRNARPVEEPGEMERLTRERDAALDEIIRLRDYIVECDEAALAETRERLETLLAATNKARTALAGFTSVEDAAFALDVAIGDIADWKRRSALSTQESSAALAGDGKERGR